MSKANTFETDLLELVFNDTALASFSNLNIALHTADPGEAGDQSTSECTFTSYARQTVARSGAGWTVSGNTVTNAADISFPTATGGSETVTHFSVGFGGSDAMLYSGALTSSIAVSSGIAITISAGQLSISED